MLLGGRHAVVVVVVVVARVLQDRRSSVPPEVVGGSDAGDSGSDGGSVDSTVEALQWELSKARAQLENLSSANGEWVADRSSLQQQLEEAREQVRWR